MTGYETCMRCTRRGRHSACHHIAHVKTVREKPVASLLTAGKIHSFPYLGWACFLSSLNTCLLTDCNVPCSYTLTESRKIDIIYQWICLHPMCIETKRNEKYCLVYVSPVMPSRWQKSKRLRCVCFGWNLITSSQLWSVEQPGMN